MHLAHLVVDPGVEQDALGGGGLAGIHMRHYADIAVMADRCGTGHDDHLHDGFDDAQALHASGSPINASTPANLCSSDAPPPIGRQSANTPYIC
ncbi:hypothetical protein D3C86_1714240 [compost metagenome]